MQVCINLLLMHICAISSAFGSSSIPFHPIVFQFGLDMTLGSIHTGRLRRLERGDSDCGAAVAVALASPSVIRPLALVTCFSDDFFVRYPPLNRTMLVCLRFGTVREAQWTAIQTASTAFHAAVSGHNMAKQQQIAVKPALRRVHGAVNAQMAANGIRDDGQNRSLTKENCASDSGKG